MELRGLTEIDVRHLLEHARRYVRSRQQGHWIVLATQAGREWRVVVRPDFKGGPAVVVTVFEERKKP